MKKLSFTQEDNGQWYVNLPDYPGEKGDLLMVMGADRLLDTLDVDNSGNVKLEVSLEEFEDYNIRLLKMLNVAGGALYSVKSDVFNTPIWLCKVIKYIFNKKPKKIYVKI